METDKVCTRCSSVSFHPPPPPLCAAIFAVGCWVLQPPVRPLHASILLLTKAHPHILPKPPSPLACHLCQHPHDITVTARHHLSPLASHLGTNPPQKTLKPPHQIQPNPRTQRSPPPPPPQTNPLPASPPPPPQTPTSRPSAGSSRARACSYPRHQAFGPDDGTLVRHPPSLRIIGQWQACTGS
jgi:hypothetical protein